MDPKYIKERIKEFSRVRENAGNDETALAEAALFIEDVFGITITDKEICEKNLGTHESAERFVLKKLNPGDVCAESAE